jgi:hypothetical protein
VLERDSDHFPLDRRGRHSPGGGGLSEAARQLEEHLFHHAHSYDPSELFVSLSVAYEETVAAWLDEERRVLLPALLAHDLLRASDRCMCDAQVLVYRTDEMSDVWNPYQLAPVVLRRLEPLELVALASSAPCPACRLSRHTELYPLRVVLELACSRYPGGRPTREALALQTLCLRPFARGPWLPVGADGWRLDVMPNVAQHVPGWRALLDRWSLQPRGYGLADTSAIDRLASRLSEELPVMQTAQADMRWDYLAVTPGRPAALETATVRLAEGAALDAVFVLRRARLELCTRGDTNFNLFYLTGEAAAATQAELDANGRLLAVTVDAEWLVLAVSALQTSVDVRVRLRADSEVLVRLPAGGLAAVVWPHRFQWTIHATLPGVECLTARDDPGMLFGVPAIQASRHRPALQVVAAPRLLGSDEALPFVPNESLSFFRGEVNHPSRTPPPAWKFGTARPDQEVPTAVYDEDGVGFVYHGQPCSMFRRRVPAHLSASSEEVRRAYGGYLVVTAFPGTPPLAARPWSAYEAGQASCTWSTTTAAIPPCSRSTRRRRGRAPTLPSAPAATRRPSRTLPGDTRSKRIGSPTYPEAIRLSR